jgi:hypothetical protein
MLRRSRLASLLREACAAAPRQHCSASSAVSLPRHFLLRLLPLSPSLTSARVLAWHCAVGTRLRAGDALLEVTTRSLLDARSGAQTETHRLVLELHEDDALLARVLVPAGTQARSATKPARALVCG